MSNDSEAAHGSECPHAPRDYFGEYRRTVPRRFDVERVGDQDDPAGSSRPDIDPVVRVDRYTVVVEGVAVTASVDQERRLRAMTDEQRANFARIMGGSS